MRNIFNDKQYSVLLLNNKLKKLVFIGCIAIVISLIIMSTTSMGITRNAVINKLKTIDLENYATSITAVIEGRIERAVDVSLMMADDPIVVKWIEKAEIDRESEKIVRNKMKKLVENFGYDTSFIVSDMTKNYWSYHGDKFELLDVVSKEDPSDDWYFFTINMQKKYEINIDHNKELNDTFVWINVLVGDTEYPIAVTGLGMNLSAVIKELIQDESVQEVKNEIFLVDGNGIVYLAKDANYMNKSISDFIPSNLIGIISNDGKNNKFTINEYKGKNGEVYDIAFKKIQGTNWTVIVQIPRSESLTFIKAIAVNTVVSCFIIILIMVAIFYWLSKRIVNPYKHALLMNEELEKKVNERTWELQDKNNRIQDSIEYAKMIQQTILPTDSELKRVLRNYFLIYDPRDTVGGDFYWIRNYGGDILLIIGDCTGHGVPGALMTTAVNAMLNHIVDETNLHDPAAILKELERLIKKSFHNDSQEDDVHYGLDAGVLYISSTKGICFSGAGISLIFILENGTFEIKASRSTIDCSNHHQEKYFKNHEISYQPGMTIFITTDGMTDQPGGDKHLPYGKKRLLSSIEDNIHLEMDQMAEHIQQAFLEYASEEIRRDDITLLGIRLD